MKGKMAVISGFSGAGKGTLVKRLIELYPEEFTVSVSKTTRSPREGEINGVHYFFVTKEEFEESIADGDFIEHAQFADNYYGTPLKWVTEKRESGVNVILEIDVQGGFQIKEKFPDTLMIFIGTKSSSVLLDRLKGRGTETPETIKKRLTMAVNECDVMNNYEYIVINDDLDTAVEEIRSIFSGTEVKKDMSEYRAQITKEIKEIVERGDFKL